MIATKIVATLGPASESKEMIEALIRAGVNVFRFNLKHNTYEWHKERVNIVREVSDSIRIPVGVLFDLQGGEIRTGELLRGDLELQNGEEVFLVKRNHENERVIVVDSSVVFTNVSEGKMILIDDGRIHLRVKEKRDEETIVTEVMQGGVLGGRKSVSLSHLPDVLPSLTDHDRECMRVGKEVNADFLALSFVRKADDIKTLQEELRQMEYNPAIISKIETADAVKNFEDILEISDGVMIARGDLGVELPPEQVPYYQKHIINRCVAVGKPVITATQMLESMVAQPYPTRAEVSDVANAMYDHTDAVMLSAETAIGKYPRESVVMMVQTATFIEQHCKPPRVQFEMHNQTDALTHAAAEFARQHYPGVPTYEAFILLTESGYSPRMLGRHRHQLPIIALTRHEQVLKRLQLQWGVTPLFFAHDMKTEESSSVTQIDEILKTVRAAQILPEKAYVILTYGSEWGKPGRTNVLRIEQL